MWHSLVSVERCPNGNPPSVLQSNHSPCSTVSNSQSSRRRKMADPRVPCFRWLELCSNSKLGKHLISYLSSLAVADQSVNWYLYFGFYCLLQSPALSEVNQSPLWRNYTTFHWAILEEYAPSGSYELSISPQRKLLQSPWLKVKQVSWTWPLSTRSGSRFCSLESPKATLETSWPFSTPSSRPTKAPFLWSLLSAPLPSSLSCVSKSFVWKILHRVFTALDWKSLQPQEAKSCPWLLKWNACRWRSSKSLGRASVQRFWKSMLLSGISKGYPGSHLGHLNGSLKNI